MKQGVVTDKVKAHICRELSQGKSLRSILEARRDCGNGGDMNETKVVFISLHRGGLQSNITKAEV